MRITIVGAGAIGGTLGAHLARAGHDMTLVDTAEDHVRAINRQGLLIDGAETFTVRIPAITPGEMRGPLGMVFLAVKTLHTDAGARQIAPHLAADGAVVSMQNGFNEERIAAVVGRQRTIGAFVNFGGDYQEPGRIMYGGAGAFYIGELDGSPSFRVRELVDVLQSAFLRNTQVTSNIWGYLWGKHAYAAMLKATALTDDTIADCLSSREARPALTNLAAEVLALAEAEGVRPEPFDGFDPQAFVFPPRRGPGRADASLEALVAFNSKSKKAKSGVWRDLAVRKRKTEVETVAVELRARAARGGIAIPLVDSVSRMIGEIESGTRALSWDNMRALIDLNARTYGAAAAGPIAAGPVRAAGGHV